MKERADIICVGGGASSFFFCAIASEKFPQYQFTILEQGKEVLNKVRISGGGRCNLTHHCFDPSQLIENYPRGKEHLLAPFQVFGPKDTIAWFNSHGVPTKVEEDGRMFPASDSSQTIIDCLTKACLKNGVQILKSKKVKNIKPLSEGSGGYQLEILDGTLIQTDKLFLAPGSSKQMWQVLEHMGHTIIPPVPSLFTFQIRDPRIKNLAGISLQNVAVRLKGTEYQTDGPFLITHKGMSGPAILKMSAIAAREFHNWDYKAEIGIDFRPDVSIADIKSWRDKFGKNLIGNAQILGLPKRLAARLLEEAKLDGQKKFASVSKVEMNTLIDLLKNSRFQIIGQNRFKEEFVTAGGVDLAEVNLGTFSSRKFPNLYFAGEVLNIDAVTGGFNFQAAWTGSFIAANSL